MIGHDTGSFGTLLYAFRKRARITQQQLAGKIGMHRHAISRWEQGEVLPASKAIVLELARHLRLNEQEARRLLEASLTAPAPLWAVPLPRNLFFTGREEILEILDQHLRSNRSLALTQAAALHGLGGVGKTQVALEYAYQHRLEYSAVFWLAAETAESIVSSLLHIAQVLQVPGREDQDQHRMVAAVQHWLSTHPGWLLIWDNVEDLDLLRRFLPPSQQGALLLTTRRQALGTLTRGLELAPMTQEEGMLFLLRRAKVLPPEDSAEQGPQFITHHPCEYAAAASLVTAMGGLPLALDQAGAFLEETQCGLQTYLELFGRRRAALLMQRGEESGAHPESVSTTFQLSITVVTAHHPAVGDLLRVCALLQPDAIPEELFRQGAQQLGAALQAAGSDELEWNRVIALACRYSLLSRLPEQHTFSLHRLVQAVLLDDMQADEQEQWTHRVVAALDAVFLEVLPEAESGIWKRAERLLPHALLCLQRAGAVSEALAALAYKTAGYLHRRGQYEQAEPLFQQALAIWKQALGSDHPQVMSALYGLALLYREQGKYAQAELLYEQALALREQVLGPDHPLVAKVLFGLAGLYRVQSDYEQAKLLSRRALAIWKQALGPDHPQVMSVLYGLALLCYEQGNYQQAEPLFQQALSLQEQALGPDHPQVAYPLNGLALLYLEQGQYEQAEPLFQRALAIWEQALGPDHPLLAQPLDNLARLYLEQGHYQQVEPLYRRALHIREEALGQQHPQVASALNGLANLYREQSHYREAEGLYQQALSMREQHLGPHHPETAQTLHDLATCYRKQGHLVEAAPLYRRALQIREQALGAAHPQTIATRTLYTRLLQQAEQPQEGRASKRQTHCGQTV